MEIVKLEKKNENLELLK